MHNISPAMRFIMIFGLVSLFSDMTYEGARAIQGAFLQTLGASAFGVGVLAGFCEFLGYVIRYFSGRWANQTQKYWHFIFVGYALNLIAIPLLAWAHSWGVAFCFILLERVGKALRVPSRDTLLAQSGESIGMGWGFGIHEALDRIGAMLGPLYVMWVIIQSQDLHLAFQWLWVPALLTLVILMLAYIYKPGMVEQPSKVLNTLSVHPQSVFKMYVIGSALMAMGFADFAFMAFHFQNIHLMPLEWIPLFYALASAANILLTPIWGYCFDKWGFSVLIGVSLLSLGFAPLVFLGGVKLVFLGVVLWGIGMGIQSSLMRAFIGQIIPRSQRANAYGIFNASFGLAWFLGSAIMGWCYHFSLDALVIFSVLCQSLGLGVYIYIKFFLKYA